MSNYFEIVNKDVCLKLNQLTFTQFKEELFNDVNTTWINEEGNNIEIEKQYTLLMKYTTELIKNNYEIKKTYTYAKGNNKGRLFVKYNGIQRLHHKIRGILCNDLYTDFDMINAHPSILLYLCKLNNYPCYSLESYVNNRNKHINDLINDLNIDRNTAKILFIKSINFNQYIKKYHIGVKKTINIKDTFFLSFDKELKEIQKLFLNNNLERKNELIKKGISDNLEGKLLNSILCEYENNILQEGIHKLKEKNLIYTLRNIVLMFDGFMIENDNQDLNNIIEELDNNQYNIKWSIKQHDISILYNLNLINTETNNNQIKLSGHFDCDVDIGEHLIKTILNEKLFRCNGIIYYLDSHILCSKKDLIKNNLCKLISNQDLYIKSLMGYCPVRNSISHINDIYGVINWNVLENKTFINNVWNNTLLKLCFKNGYYDFKKGEFIKNYNGVCTPFIIDKDLNLTSNPDIRKQIFKRVINPIFSIEKEESDEFHLMEYIMHKLARVMAGHIEDKNWYKFQGLRDSGKGVLCDLFKNAFESYIQYTNASNFMNKKGDEDAKALSWIIDYQFSRLAITQEIALEDGKFIDGNKIKKFCSGGDCFSARKNFQDEIEFKIQSGLLICCNDIPDIKPNDAMEKCITFKMKSKFVKDIEKESKYTNFKYYLADNDLKRNFINDPEVLNEFILLIFDYYNKTDTKYPLNILKDLNSNDDDDEEKLLNLFTIQNSNEKLYNNELKKIMKDNEINMSISKATDILIGKGASKFRNSKGRGLKGVAEHCIFELDEIDSDDD
tara:strand:+ start:2569 stop:4920 length:2352 start_codon:yes stop_codon:yes gene_type:complete